MIDRDDPQCLAEMGLRLATFGNMHAATHAICRCGVIAGITEDSHSCTWRWLVPVEGVPEKDDPGPQNEAPKPDF